LRAARSSPVVDASASVSQSPSVSTVATLVISRAFVQWSPPASNASRILGRPSDASEIPISSLTLLFPMACSVHA
jgi:hypothetical protein